MATDGKLFGLGFGLGAAPPPPRSQLLADALCRGMSPPTPAEALEAAAMVAAATMGRAQAVKLLRKIAGQLERGGRYRRPAGRKPVDDARLLQICRDVLRVRPDVTPAQVATELAALRKERGMPMQSEKAEAERIRRKLVAGAAT